MSNETTTAITIWFFNILINYVFLRPIRIIGDPGNWSSDNWEFYTSLKRN